MHEQSETIERDGRYYNVYGRGTPQAGQVLPGEPAYDSQEAAVAAARARSRSHDHMDAIDQATVAKAGLTPIENRIAGYDELITGLSKAGDKQFERSEEAIGQMKDAQIRRNAEMQPLYDRMRAVKPPGAEFKQERVPDFQRPTVTPQEMNETMGVLMATAMLVSVGARQPFYGAMAGMTGALDGILKGDAARVGEAMKTYDLNVAAIKQRNDAARTEYDAAWNKYKNDLGALEREMKIIASKYGDEMAVYELDKLGAGEALKRIDARMRQAEQAVTRLESTKANLDAARERAQMAADARRDAAAARADARRDADARREDEARFRQTNQLIGRYQREAMALQTESQMLDKVLELAAQGNNPQAIQQMQSALTALFKGTRGTNYQLQMQQNAGNIGERVAGLISRFLTGTPTEWQINDVRDMAQRLRSHVIDPERQRIAAHYRSVAERHKLNPDDIVGEITPMPSPATPAAPAAATPGAPKSYRGLWSTP